MAAEPGYDFTWLSTITGPLQHAVEVIEEHEVGKFVLQPDQPVDFRAEVPPSARGSEPLNVRLEASDHVYRGDDLRHCVAYRLESIALE